jgi:hypothetical protein
MAEVAEAVNRAPRRRDGIVTLDRTRYHEN